MTAPLYALAAEYQALLERCESGEDVGDALAALDEAIEAKALNICHVLAQLDADEAAADREAERLSMRSKRFGEAAERLRAYIKQHMEAAGIKRIKSAQFSITLAKGQPKVVILDASKVPPELMRQPKTPPPEPDKPAILKLHTETGEIPPGCDIVPTTRLTVR